MPHYEDEVVLGGDKYCTVVHTEHHYGFTYTTSPWCDSKGVAVLPFRRIYSGVTGKTTYEYLGRFEICPAHSDDHELCIITGGWDDPAISLPQTAIKELKEEGGYTGSLSEIVWLGTVRPSKASVYQAWLYAVDLTGKERGEATTDGTLGEIGAWSDWVSEQDIIACKDPVATTALARLKLHLFGGGYA